MITRYVNLASTAGGDGTTNDTTGEHRAYASLQECESQEQGSMSDDLTIYCTGSGGDSYILFEGWTYNGYSIYIIGEQDGGKTTDTTKYYIDGEPTAGHHALEVKDTGCKFQVENVALRSADYGANSGMKVTVGASSGSFVKLINCTLEPTSSSNTDGWGFTGDEDIDCYAYNCLIKGMTDGGVRNVSPLNCVFIDNNTAADYKTFSPVNNIFQGNTTDSNGWQGSPSNNLTDKSSLSGTDNVVNTTLTFKGTGDYRLDSGDTEAMGAGLGTSEDSRVYSEDVDGDSRPSTDADIGLDEYKTSIVVLRRRREGY